MSPGKWSVVAIAILVVLTILLLVPGHLRRNRRAANEAAAVGSLVVYLSGCATCNRLTHNESRHPLEFPTLRQMAENGLIDETMASSGPDRPKAGYYFVEIIGATDESTGRARVVGLCAVPADYPASGRCTFVLDAGGSVYQKDNGGKPVRSWSDVEAGGWELGGG